VYHDEVELIPVHVGVCNTDNFSLLSVTMDYGPFSFMEDYNPGIHDFVNAIACL